MIRKENSNVLRLIFGTILFLALIYATNPPSRENMLTYIIILGASSIVYLSSKYQRTAIGIGFKNLGKSLFWAVLLSVVFYFASKLIPGFSIGFPNAPQALSDQLKFFIIVLIAPIAEEIFFRGAILAYMREYNPSKRSLQVFIVVQAILFALAHLGAYVFGFYTYGTLTQGLTAVSANLSVFISAFIFGYLAGFFVSRDGIKNLFFSIIFHLILNLIIFTSKFAIIAL